MSDKTKELIKSNVLTFLTGFLLVVVPAIETLSLDQLHDGTLAGILLAATRMGLKMVLQAILTKGEQVL